MRDISFKFAVVQKNKNIKIIMTKNIFKIVVLLLHQILQKNIYKASNTFLEN